VNLSPSPRLWQFSAFDSWFFRESRPFDSIGGAVLSGRFPPPARTLLGALRTAVGEAAHVDWSLYNQGQGDYEELRQQMGDARTLGTLRMSGPYLLEEQERLFPAPLLLLAKSETLVRLRPGKDAVQCDLGRVRLPQLERPLPGAAPLENVWLSRTNMEEVLAGGVPASGAGLRQAGELWNSEDRLGIGRDNRRRSHDEGLLYQTRHVRPQETLSVGVQLDGVDEKYQPAQGHIRLGGEGRFSFFQSAPTPLSPLALPTLTSNKIVLVLVTPADFGDESGNARWYPPGFEARPDGWYGNIEGVLLRIVSAILGRAVREGGWDLASGAPRPVRGLVPAGSCYFCEVDGDASLAAAQLHHRKIGADTALGRGEIVVGQWDDSPF